jgi:hypothetical protein
MHTRAFRGITPPLQQILPLGTAFHPLELLTKVESEIPINGKGSVKFLGIFWRAQCYEDMVLAPGTLVRIVDRTRNTLIVEPVTNYAPYFKLSA